MQLARHTIASHTPRPTFIHGHLTLLSPDAQLSPQLVGDAPKTAASTRGKARAATDAAAPTAKRAGLHPAQNAPTASLLACATPKGFMVLQVSPLKVVARREFPASRGTLSQVAAIDGSSLLLLVGGGRVPLFAPNKVILWDEAAEVEADDAPASTDPAPRVELSSSGPGSLTDTPNFFGSPQASTVFSAGSTFDRRDTDDTEEQLQAAMQASRSMSMDLDDDDHQGAVSSTSRSISPAPMSPVAASEPLDSQPDRSASPEPLSDLPSFSGMFGSSASLSVSTTEAGKQDVHASVYSISASSAGLEDPFAVTTKSAETAPPVQTVEDASTPGEGAVQRPTTPPPKPSVSDEAAPATPRGILSTHSSPKASMSTNAPRRSDSVASSSQQPQPQQPRRQVRPGRVVAQLEFDEAVQGIRARSFQLPQSGTSASDRTSASKAALTHVAIIVVILRTRAIVFELGPTVGTGSGEDGKGWGIKQRLSLDIHSGKKGLADLCLLPDRSSALLALTGRQAGHVQLVRLPLLSSKSSSTGAASIIAAHSSSLASITLSADGTMLATTSSKGTLIRVWRTLRSGAPIASAGGGTGVGAGKKLMIGATLWKELRRGTDPATILSVAFSPDNAAIAAASDKGTVHMWHLVEESDGSKAAGAESGRSSPRGASTTPPAAQHQRSPSSGLAARYLPSALGNLASSLPSSMLPQYLSSNWSAAQFRIPLKTFAAFDRGAAPSPRLRTRTGQPMSTRAGRTEMEGPSPFTTAGASRSTDGAWATMRGRIDDARRGEAGVDERIVLGWIRAPLPVKRAGGKGRRGKTEGEGEAGEEEEYREGEFQLLAFTTSGGCYRLRLDPPSSSTSAAAGGGTPSKAPTGSTVLDMYAGVSDDAEGMESPGSSTQRKAGKAKGGTRGSKGASEGCTLLDFSSFREGEGEWGAE